MDLFALAMNAFCIAFSSRGCNSKLNAVSASNLLKQSEALRYFQTVFLLNVPPMRYGER